MPPISNPGSAPALSRLERGTPVLMPHPFGSSNLAPSVLQSSCPPWKPGAPADLELATGLHTGSMASGTLTSAGYIRQKNTKFNICGGSSPSWCRRAYTFLCHILFKPASCHVPILIHRSLLHYMTSSGQFISIRYVTSAFQSRNG